MSRQGLVSLVGGGPGDPGLITVKGLDRLRRADVVVHDRLVDASLVEVARVAGAEVVPAGKAPGRKEMAQEAINALMVRMAKAGKRVVRLKGGDPFVFGRGGEEAEALSAAGVPFEVVPGVTSAVAAPAYAGIPVTDRRLASSVAFVTGTPGPGRQDRVREAAAADTVVVLMGVARLPEVTAALVEGGKAPDTPSAVVERGTLASQRTVTARLDRIARRVRDAGVENPAVLVSGGVVGMRRALRWFDAVPLFGRTVLVTRTREQAGALSALLRERGAISVEAPAIRLLPVPVGGRLDTAIRDAAMGAYVWVAFTSASAVGAWFDRAALLGLDARGLRAHVAAVGSGTAEALLDRGVVADLVPKTFTTAALGRAFPRGSGKVLLPRADIAPAELEEALRRKGWTPVRVIAYRTRTVRSLPPEARKALRAGRIDALAFTSASTVEGFVRMAGVVDGPVVACIGPTTAAAASEAGFTVHAVARPHTIEGLVNALSRALRRRR